MKAQSAIISTILLSGIILAIVTATYIWGQPLVQKTTDKIKIDGITDDLSLIKDRIDHTQQTGSPTEVTLNIKDANYQISSSDNAIIVKTTTLVPVITSYTFVPISYTELPYDTELIDINTSRATDTVTKPEGYTTGVIHFGNVSLNNVEYNISVYNTSSSIYDTVCFYQGEDINPVDCIKEIESITKEGIEYTLSWLSNDGTEVIISGGQKENIGILGTDPAGIIMGKSQPISKNQQVTINLAFRSLRDSTGRTYKTIIQCDTGCRTSDGIKKLKIERVNTERTFNSTNYYIKVYFE